MHSPIVGNDMNKTDSDRITGEKIARRIADEIGAQTKQVNAAIEMLDEGSTVPFIARYRKERTGGLDDEQLRTLEERLAALRELEKRRAAILSTIDEQGKLDPKLKARIETADSRTELEDLYLPYRVKRHTRAQAAREAGLEPLAMKLLQNPGLSPQKEAAAFISREHDINAPEAALEGAGEIIIEKMAENAELLGKVRGQLGRRGRLATKLKKGKEQDGQKFADYFDFSEDFGKIPSHRALAMLRGVQEKALSISLDLETESGELHPCEQTISRHFNIRNEGRPADGFLQDTVHKAWISKLKRKLVTELMNQLREQAETEAISVFANNLKDLLLAAPAGPRATLGLDPGYRSGVKVAVVDKTGKLLATDVIYPHPPQKQWDRALAALAALVRKHGVELISIGNGTASRETDKLAAELIKALPEQKLTRVTVSEAGASVYSASKLATEEFPDVDVSLRGAASIARRLQDPLAELVKIEPKAIGVGQYQHDVDQNALARSLDATVEDCVNKVGVDVNMASAALLTHVSGLNKTLAENIVAYRDKNGPFKSRAALKKVPRLGPKAFEQGAGFLRINDGKNPLDGSAVHPEAYELVERIAKQRQRSVKSMIGDGNFLKSIQPSKYADERFGVPTISDILSELQKPGRDPRPGFKAASFAEGVEEISDVKPGMRLQGVVTNVTNFGAFIDIGVHQDGLAHISQLADRFINDPREVVKAGDVVNVRVLEVDAARKRISLSMKTASAEDQPHEGRGGPAQHGGASGRSHSGGDQNRKKTKAAQEPPSSNPFADAFRKAGRT